MMLYCPLCESPLVITPHEIHPQYEDVKCTFRQGFQLYDYSANAYSNTHYRKYVTTGFGGISKVEEMTIFPFQIINCDNTYNEHRTQDGEVIPAHDEQFCFIKKYNPEYKTVINQVNGQSVQIPNPHFEKIHELPAHIHADLDERLRERLKVLLMLL
jgi:leucyl-tRNA synthetase